MQPAAIRFLFTKIDEREFWDQKAEVDYIAAANTYGQENVTPEFPDYHRVAMNPEKALNPDHKCIIHSLPNGDMVISQEMVWKKKKRFEAGKRVSHFVITNGVRDRLLRNWTSLGLIEINKTPKFGLWTQYNDKSLDLEEHKGFFTTHCTPYMEREYL